MRVPWTWHRDGVVGAAARMRPDPTRPIDRFGWVGRMRPGLVAARAWGRPWLRSSG